MQINSDGKTIITRVLSFLIEANHIQEIRITLLNL